MRSRSAPPSTTALSTSPKSTRGPKSKRSSLTGVKPPGGGGGGDGGNVFADATKQFRGMFDAGGFSLEKRELPPPDELAGVRPPILSNASPRQHKLLEALFELFDVEGKHRIDADSLTRGYAKLGYLVTDDAGVLKHLTQLHRSEEGGGKSKMSLRGGASKAKAPRPESGLAAEAAS